MDSSNHVLRSFAEDASGAGEVAYEHELNGPGRGPHLRRDLYTFALAHNTRMLHVGPAPVRRFLPEMIDLVYDGKINPGKVFDLTLPLSQVAEGYRAMNERRSIKTLLLP